MSLVKKITIFKKIKLNKIKVKISNLNYLKNISIKYQIFITQYIGIIHFIFILFEKKYNNLYQYIIFKQNFTSFKNRVINL